MRPDVREATGDLCEYAQSPLRVFKPLPRGSRSGLVPARVSSYGNSVAKQRRIRTRCDASLRNSQRNARRRKGCSS